MQGKNIRLEVWNIAGLEFPIHANIEFPYTVQVLFQQFVFLWFQDQYETIALHTQKGIDFLEKYGHFIRDRCAIELEYAGKLR